MSIAITSGTFEIISTRLPFAFGDVSKSIMIQGAGPGGGTLLSTITEVSNSATASIADAAFTTIATGQFLFGTNFQPVVQGMLELAASTTQSLNTRTVTLPAGTFLIDTNADTASLKVQDGVTLKGQGPGLTTLVGLGVTGNPIIKNSGSITRDFVIRDFKLNGVRDLNTGSGGPTGIFIQGGQDFELSNLLAVSCSADGITITGSSQLKLTGISTRDNGNGIVVIDSDNLTLDGISDSGSIGYGILLSGVTSSSLGTLALDEGGSGSVVEASGSAGNTILGFEPNKTYQVAAPVNNPSGSYVQFVEGGPRLPGFGTVQGALMADFSGLLDNNWLGIVGRVTSSEDLIEPADLTPFFSISMDTGRTNFSGSSFSVAQPITALNGVTGSFTGAMDLQIGKLTGSVLINSGSTAIHELVDVGAQSSSFTISFDNGNFKKITIGSSIGIGFSNLAQGQVSVLEIDNTGNHIVTLPGSSSGLIWSAGITGSIPTGSSIMTLTEISIGTFANFPGQDIS